MENRLQKLAVTLVFALGASVVAPLAAGAEPPGASADVLVIVRPQQSEGEAFRQVVTDAARNAIESRGLVMSLPAAPPGEGAAGGSVKLARDTHAAVALDCIYTVESREMAITIDWYDASTGARSAHGEGRGRVDLQLDRVITDVLSSVLASADDQVRTLRAAREKSVAESPGAGTQAAAQPPGVPVPPTGGPFRTIAPTRMLLAASFAPFIATGAAAYYFTVGYLPSILASVIFTTTAGRIGLGLSAGMDYFYASGSEDTSDNYLFPLGVDVRYEFAQPRFVFFLHLAGGPAALLVLTGSHQTLVNLVPFVRSGVGAEIFLSPLIGIGINADYEIYFVMPYLLMGFTPALSMTFRL